MDGSLSKTGDIIGTTGTIGIAMLRSLDSHVVTVIGARPQFVKAAMLSRRFAERDGIRETLVHTGQHYDHNMSGVFFDELDIPDPGYHLGIGSGTHGKQTGLMLQAIEEVLLKESPDWLVVYGDTNSTLAGALAASKLHVPTAHVEAGLRSNNRRMPEEINRVLVDHVSQVLFTSSQSAADNLVNEGVERGRIHVVGDVMCDAVQCYAKVAEAKSSVLERLGVSAGEYTLVTVHRAENTDCARRFTALLDGLKELANDAPVVWPLHPRTRRTAEKLGLLAGLPENLMLIEPVGYLDILRLQMGAKLVATDSGGIQKEAFYLHVPCLTLRDETEWGETIELGWNRLVRSSEFGELARIARQWADDVDRKPIPGALHGGGQAASRICDVLSESQPVFH